MRRLAFILIIAIVGTTTVYAADGEPVQLMVGRSTVLDTGAPIARVSLTSADIADALVTSTNQVLINGKNPGTISMFVWDRAGSLRRYEVTVQRDLARLSEQLTQLFPGESIVAHSSGKSIVLSGNVSSKEMADKAMSVAAGHVDKKEDVVSLLQVTSRGANQVLLRVRFAEVSRSALTQLGSAFFTSPLGVKNTLARVTTQQYAAPGFEDLKVTKSGLGFGDPVQSAEGKFTFGDFLNFFLFSEKYDIDMMVKALQTRGLFQSLAEPNLVAESGKEASFLAGGEFPVPIAQPSGGAVAVTIMFKEFGVRLNFTPVVNGDRVHLKVKPEVSTLDFANGVTLQGFRIPALATRRTETELELQNGQTFAIAGLLNNQMNKTLQKIPGIGDIPILGLLFRSQAAQKDQTELVVMITPEILPAGSNGVTPNLPRLVEPYMTPMDPRRTKEPPPPAFVPSGRGAAMIPQQPVANTPAQAAQATQTTTTTSPAAAAAKVQALTPTTKPIVNPDTLTARPPATTPTSAPAPSTPGAASAPATSASQPPTIRPLTADEQALLDRVRKAEWEKRQAERSTTVGTRQDQRKAEEDRRRLEEVSKRQAREAGEDAQRAMAEAKRQAAIQKAADETAAKRNAEAAKKQAENEKKQQKAVSEAQAKLKAAQAAYEAELAKSKKQ